jgi:hypothetical protein
MNWLTNALRERANLGAGFLWRDEGRLAEESPDRPVHSGRSFQRQLIALAVAVR